MLDPRVRIGSLAAAGFVFVTVLALSPLSPDSSPHDTRRSDHGVPSFQSLLSRKGGVK